MTKRVPIIFMFLMFVFSLTFLFCACNNGKTEITTECIKLNETSFVYDGQEQKPKPQVVVKNKVLEENKDYVLYYENNTNAGKAYVVVQALEESKLVKGQAKCEFVITKRNLSDTRIEVSSLNFSGDPNVLPQTKVFVGEKEIESLNYSSRILEGGYPDTQNVLEISAAQNSNFEGVVSKSFEVFYMNLEEATIEVESVSFDGTPKTPDFSVKVGDFVVPQTVVDEFETVYENNINASGEASLNIKVLSSNHFFEVGAQKEIKFAISKASFSQVATISDIEDKQYDGVTSFKVIPEIFAFSTGLVFGTDFDVIYYRDNQKISEDSDFIDGGYITILASGKGNYSGALTKTYFIKGIDISDSDKLSITIDDSELVFNGLELIPQISITYDGQEFYYFHTTYQDNILAGVNTAKAIISFYGNYSGSVERNFSIGRQDIGEFLFELLEEETTFLPNGAQILCDLKNPQGQSLVLGYDYELFYEDNLSVTENALVKAVGINNYCGETQFLSFKVSALEIDSSFVFNFQNELEFSGLEQKQNVVLKVDGQTIDVSNYDLAYYSDYSQKIEATDFVSAGQTIFVEINAKNNLKNRDGGLIVLSYSILSAEITDENLVVNLSQTEFDYDSNLKTPTVLSVLFNGVILDEENYDYTYKNNQNAGRAFIEFVGKGNVFGTAQKQFEIKQISILDSSVIFVGDKTFDSQSLNLTPQVSQSLLTENDFDVYVFDENDQLVSHYQTNAGTYKICVFGKNNFKGEVIGYTQIKKAENKIEKALSISNWEYLKTPTEPQIEVLFGEPVYDFRLLNDTTYFDLMPNKIGTYVVRATVLGGQNYYDLVAEQEFKITKRNIADSSIAIKTLTIEAGMILSCEIDVLIDSTIIPITEYDFVSNLNGDQIEITITSKNDATLVYGEVVKLFEQKQTNNLSIICEDEYVYGNIISVSANALVGSANIKIFKTEQNNLIEKLNNQVLDAGTYVVVATLETEGYYKVSSSKNFVVSKKPFSEQTFDVSTIQDEEYDGTAKTNFEQIEILDLALNHLLENGKDFYIETSGSLYNVGKVEITIHFVGNYSGSYNTSFNITKKVIVHVETLNTIYNGSEINLGITPDQNFEYGVDYEIKYYIDQSCQTEASALEKTNAGIVYAKVRSLNGQFEDYVVLVNIEKAQNQIGFVNIKNFEYGDEITKPEVITLFGTLVVKFAKLNENTKTFDDFEEWTNTNYPNSFGTYGFKFEIAESQNYLGFISSTYMFEITEQEIRSENITLTFNGLPYTDESIVYNGSDQRPTVVIKDKFNNPLTQSTDYILRLFHDGKPTAGAINVGTYEFWIDGRNNYKASQTIKISFRINEPSA